jgi:hypothetical protein
MNWQDVLGVVVLIAIAGFVWWVAKRLKKTRQDDNRQ